jgi:hypothetical protein
MRLDSSGNLGLGVTPSAWYSNNKALQIGSTGAVSNYTNGANIQTFLSNNVYWNAAGTISYITTNTATSYTQDNGAHKWYSAASGTAGNAISFTQAMTLTAAGRLGLGLTSPSSLFEAYGGAAGTSSELTVGNASTAARFGVDTSNEVTVATGQAVSIKFLTSNTERARIDSSGNLLVGTTSTSSTSGTGLKITAGSSNADSLSIVTGATTNAGLTTYQLYSTGAGAYRFYVGAGGTVFATSTTISAISDQRLKENVQDLDAGLDKIMALKPRKFDWKAGKGKDIKGDRGWIAQEFEQVFPDMIDTWKDEAPEGEEPYKSVRADLIPVLVKAIQELKAEFDAYKATHP